MKRADFSLRRHFLAALEVLGALLLLSMVALALQGAWLLTRGVVGPGTGEEELVPHLAPLLMLQALVFVPAGWLLGRVRLGPQPPRSHWLEALGLGTVGGALAFALAFAVGWLQQWLGWPVEEQEILVQALRDPDVRRAALPAIVFFVPLGEELFFRGYAFRLLETRSAFLPAALASATLFALVHLNPSGIPVYVLLGLVLALLTRLSGRVSTAVAAHVVFNGLVLAATWTA